MTHKARGQTGTLITEKIGDIVDKADGSSWGDVTYFITPYSGYITNAPKVRIDGHPLIPHLICQERRVSYVKPDGARIVCTYAGATENTVTVTLGGASPAATEVEVVPSLQQNPIDMHERILDWESIIKTDKEGNFEKWDFKGNEEAKLRFKGVDSYYEPSVTFRRSYTTSEKPDLSNLRKIFDKPDGAPEVGPRNWLLTGIPYRDFGNGDYAVTEEYMMSGKNGWNPYIYGEAEL